MHIAFHSLNLTPSLLMSRAAIALAALVFLGAAALWSDPAAAQVVCGGSATGAAPLDGNSASAAAAHDTACGRGAEASGSTTLGDPSGGATAYGFDALRLAAIRPRSAALPGPAPPTPA